MTYRYLFKLVVIGNSHVGKSAIVKRFCDNKFLPTFDSTIGVDFSAAQLTIDTETNIKLQIWDTAGQECFAPIIRSYYRGVAGVILVFDVGDRLSFRKLSFWLSELNSNKDIDHPIPIIIVGHKSDKKYRQVSTEEAEDFAQKNNTLYVEASAKTGINVEKIFQRLARKILINIENGHKIGTRKHPIYDSKPSMELIAKRGDSNSFLSCCCLC